MFVLQRKQLRMPMAIFRFLLRLVTPPTDMCDCGVHVTFAKRGRMQASPQTPFTHSQDG